MTSGIGAGMPPASDHSRRDPRATPRRTCGGVTVVQAVTMPPGTACGRWAAGSSNGPTPDARAADGGRHPGRELCRRPRKNSPHSDRRLWPAALQLRDRVTTAESQKPAAADLTDDGVATPLTRRTGRGSCAGFARAGPPERCHAQCDAEQVEAVQHRTVPR